MTKLTYIDLFCGAGGMSLGFKQAGFENVFSIDCDRDSCNTYRKNMRESKLIEKNIEELSNTEIADLANGKEIDLVIGGTPCQGFSMAGSIGRQFLYDPRNHLFKEFARVVEIFRPKFFVIENVARVYNHNGGNTRKEIVDLFTDAGYSVNCAILNTADYGVAQLRRRIFIMGNRLGMTNKFPEKMSGRHKTIKDVIEDLPKLLPGEESQIPNHTAMRHSNQMLLKMSYVQDGGSRDQIPLHIRPRSGDARKYIKYDRNAPSVCVTGDMRKIFHYSQNRALTVRELARLQSFPDSFVFVGNKISQQQQVGNAVPPLLAKVVADTIKSQLLVKSEIWC